MAILTTKINDTADLVVDARESDEHTQSMLVSFKRVLSNGETYGQFETYISPLQLELVGRYLLRCAEETKMAQHSRDISKTN